MSNAVQLLLRPMIRSAKYADVPDPFGGPVGIATIQVEIMPAIASRQSPTLWLNASAVGSTGYGLRSLLRRELDPSFEADLDAGSVSIRGRDTLAAAGLPADGEFRVIAAPGGRVWTLEDIGRGRTYVVRADAGGLMIYFGLTPGSSTTTAAFWIQVAGQLHHADPALRVAPGEYLARLMVDPAPPAISALTGGPPYDAPSIRIPG
jgi:hypothetical protein